MMDSYCIVCMLLEGAEVSKVASVGSHGGSRFHDCLPGHKRILESRIVLALVTWPRELDLFDTHARFHKHPSMFLVDSSVGSIDNGGKIESSIPITFRPVGRLDYLG
uniref:Uncharacterized protein n=1 Tax=Cyclophora tenuis TaxID=216820 RepID=A0A6U1R5X3_CYCTE